MQLTYFVSQLPAPPSGAIENWLLSAAAVASLVALGKKLFVRKPAAELSAVETLQTELRSDLRSLRERLDERLLAVMEKLDQVKTELLAAQERQIATLQVRLNQLESELARVDERTKK